MKRPIATLLALTSMLSLYAQVEWSTKVYDFGTIREADGVARGNITMYNRTDSPVVILRVKPSCGCTAAGFTEGEVMPGDSAVLWIDYNTAGRPGSFEKNVKVYLNDNPTSPVQLRLKGIVIGTEESVAKICPYEAGPLRLSTLKLTTGPVYRGNIQTQYITAYNISESPVTPAWDTKGLPVSVSISNDTVPPGEMVTLGVYYHSRKDNMFGTTSRELLLYPSGLEVSDPVTITMETELLPDPAEYSAEDMAKAPVIQMKKDLTDLGTIKPGQKQIKVEFELENVGKSLLQIPRVYSQQEGASVKKLPLRLAPGKKGKVAVMVYPELLEAGPFHIKIEICSNDPVHPFITHRIVGIKP